MLIITHFYSAKRNSLLPLLSNISTKKIIQTFNGVLHLAQVLQVIHDQCPEFDFTALKTKFRSLSDTEYQAFKWISGMFKHCK